MPKPRNKENLELPTNWRFRRNAYYYRVPPGMESHWNGKQEVLLGKTFNEALANFESHSDRILRDSKVNLLADSEIIEKSLPIENASGIMFFIHQMEIVFISKGLNLFSRLAELVNENMEFDSVYFTPQNPEDLDYFHALYVAKYKPKHNVITYKKHPQ